MSVIDRLDIDNATSIGSRVLNERVRAHMKYRGGRGGSMEEKSWDHPIWLAVLTEEVGEVARALCEQSLGNVGKVGARDQLHTELMQVAAMATAWIAAIEDEDDDGR